MSLRPLAGATDNLSATSTWLFRRQGSRTWERLGATDSRTDEGFFPVAVDPDRDIAWGFRRIDGRDALVARALDGTDAETPMVVREDVDVDGVVRIGRRGRVIGGSYATDRRVAVYFDPEMARLRESLQKALPPGTQISILDSSVDERRLLVWAGRDDDAGVHYLLDRDSGEMRTLVVSRPELEGLTLAKVESIQYRAADGTMVPAYPTLPPSGPRSGLPAIVLPHGGPSARDEWGFDWLSQYFAAKGYAVIQPNFRGSAGYGEAWLLQNGFRSWAVAVGDVLDAGRHLVREGIADPAKLGIVGWSYGGYAALQSAVVDPGLFRAVVAIAPVTDFEMLREEFRNFVTYRLRADQIGSGPHIREGSPAQQADRIVAPVLLFHGSLDRNVGVRQSQLMADRLRRAGRNVRLVTWDHLDHFLEDSAARAQMLRESDAFLKAAFTP
ncbi:MAG: alpha/beta fold hydrolase [Sphingomonadaceae bacterium]